MQKYDIFISYRRIGGAQYARILQLMLLQRGYNVFLDYDELTDGNFSNRIQQAIKGASVFILILSKGALERCIDERDWVRKEIQLALSEGKHIIPVNPDNSFDGIPEDIPVEIKEGVSVHQYSDINFGQTLGVTVDFMVKCRIAPIIGERLRLDSDAEAQKEDKSLKRHRLYVRIIISWGIVFAIGIIYWLWYSRKEQLGFEQRRKHLIEQVEKYYPGLNLRANDSLTIARLEVLYNLFSNMRDVYGDTIKFSAFETTVKEYHTILGEGFDTSKSLLPVTNVSFGKTLLYINKINELISSDENHIYFSLPTKEEWEYAASGGDIDNTIQFSGSNNIEEVAWYNQNSEMTVHPADGQSELKPNAFGLYDMSGNVWEYVYAPYIDHTHPESPTNLMLIKGGCYASDYDECRISYELPMEIDLTSPKVGFRLVLRITNR